MSHTQPKRAAVAILLVAVLLRAGVLWKQSDNLAADRDAYLGIAQGLAAGNGYSNPGTRIPTAYRPPLYPVVLAGILRLGGGDIAIGLLHLVLGTATVLLTLVSGRKLGLGRAALFAAALVAVDPLLLQYTTFVMTETTFTFLVTLLLALLVTRPSLDGLGDGALARAVVGFVFGLCALCRPTIWVFGCIASIWWIRVHVKTDAFSRFACFRQVVPWPALLAVALTVSPWFVRNLVAFGRPILTTTHGGYTLLLGNNPVFYREVVGRPWGTLWGGNSHDAWDRSLKEAMKKEVAPIRDESARDRWMYRRAVSYIVDDPRSFVAACWLRFRRFWNVAPLGPAAASVPAAILWCVGLFYLVVTTGLILGLARLRRLEWRRWMPVILLLLSFTLVHLVFWSNMRMRAPLIPAIALLAVGGWRVGIGGVAGAQPQPPDRARGALASSPNHPSGGSLALIPSHPSGGLIDTTPERDL